MFMFLQERVQKIFCLNKPKKILNFILKPGFQYFVSNLSLFLFSVFCFSIFLLFKTFFNGIMLYYYVFIKQKYCVLHCKKVYFFTSKKHLLRAKISYLVFISCMLSHSRWLFEPVVKQIKSALCVWQPQKEVKGNGLSL